MNASAGDSRAGTTAPRLSIVFVVAVADNGVIGRNGTLPWRLKSDLRHFRALTLGRPVVMGRKTFLSIGKPLAGRTNVVVTHDAAFTAPGILVAPGLAEALAAARGDALRRSADSIAVIGGADIFAQTLPLADRLELTRVHSTPDGDTFLPPIDLDEWREIARADRPAGPGDDASFTLLTYVRAAALGMEEGRRP